MHHDDNRNKNAGEFVHLFFPDPTEETVAVALTNLLGSFVGDQIRCLRPDSNMIEVQRWIRAAGRSPIDFVLSVERRFDVDFEPVGESFDALTFRQLVQFITTNRRKM
jgi:hypothetical protein